MNNLSFFLILGLQDHNFYRLLAVVLIGIAFILISFIGVNENGSQK